MGRETLYASFLHNLPRGYSGDLSTIVNSDIPLRRLEIHFFPAWLALRNHCSLRFHDSPNNKPHTHEMEQFASKKVPESKGDFRERSLHYTNRFFSPFLRMYRVPTVSFVLLPRHIHAHDNFFFFALSIPVPRFAGSQDDVFGPLETLWGPRN